MSSPAYSIKTDRLLIRCYDPKDAYLLKEAIDESLDHLSTWLDWTKNEPEDIETKIQRLRKNRANFDLNENYVYGIFLPDNSKLVGSIALMARVGENALEIGYWIHKDFLNKGFATEATKCLIRVAFEVENVERVEIHCDPTNIESRAIPEKLGFKNEAIIRKNSLKDNGERKQSMIWTLFKEEYEISDIKNFKLEAFDVIDRKII